MAVNLCRRYGDFPFNAPVEILHYCLATEQFTAVGVVGLLC